MVAMRFPKAAEGRTHSKTLRARADHRPWRRQSIRKSRGPVWLKETLAFLLKVQSLAKSAA